MKKTISENHKYSFPNPIVEVRHRDKIIIIAKLTANWIVLDNESQYVFFQLLKDYSLGEALHKYNGDIEDAKHVVMQLEARDFESCKVMRQENKGLHLYLTNQCNMRCPHCYMSAGEKKVTRELQPNEVKSILTDYKRTGGELVTFSGGEVALCKNLLEYVIFAKTLGLTVEVLTNGVLWNAASVSQIAPYLDRVQISIDGYSEEVNATVRGKGNFQKALLAIDLFVNKGVYTTIGITPFPSDSLYIDFVKYADFAKTLLDKYGNKNFALKFTAELWNGRDITISQEENQKYKDTIDKINALVYGEHFYDEGFIEYHRRKGVENNCSFGNLNIDSNGDVYLCPVISEIEPIGNIRTQDFDEIDNFSQQAIKLTEAQSLRPCKDCELVYICGGGCRIKFFEAARKGNIKSYANALIRECTTKYKQEIYDQMIRTNEDIFQ